jgi:hypothetical protein
VRGCCCSHELLTPHSTVRRRAWIAVHAFQSSFSFFDLFFPSPFAFSFSRKSFGFLASLSLAHYSPSSPSA